MQLFNSLSQIINISTELEKALTSFISKKSFKKNEFLLRADEYCNSLYFVEKGSLRGFYFHEEKEITNWFALEGDFGTSFYPFISKTRSYENIQALEDVEVSVLNNTELKKLYSDFPETEKLGRIILEDYYSKLEERLINIQFKSAKERYSNLMENRPQIIQRVPLGHLASYLGITQETLSRIRAGN
ncbi:MAG: Crp/Fnr family transcriptional regulator [Bacteroidia bacterium]|nr:Crp/Fnr family transcriptional regulator [Bacteroidia bacterium]